MVGWLGRLEIELLSNIHLALMSTYPNGLDSRKLRTYSYPHFSASNNNMFLLKSPSEQFIHVARKTRKFATTSLPLQDNWPKYRSDSSFAFLYLPLTTKYENVIRSAIQ